MATQTLSEAIPHLDTLFTLLPTFDEFMIGRIIKSSTLLNKNELSKCLSELETLLLVTFGYAEKYHPDNFAMHLNSAGREAKSMGHFAYQKEITSHLKFKNKDMVSEDTLLKYFLKQNKILTIDDLMKKYETDDNILKPINNLVDEDWLEAIDALKWRITDDGRHE